MTTSKRTNRKARKYSPKGMTQVRRTNEIPAMLAGLVRGPLPQVERPSK